MPKIFISFIIKNLTKILKFLSEIIYLKIAMILSPYCVTYIISKRNFNFFLIRKEKIFLNFWHKFLRQNPKFFFSIPHMWYTIPFVLLLLVLFVSISINLEELKVENMKSNIDLVWYVCLLCRNGKSLSWWFIQPVHSSIKYSFYTPITNKLPLFFIYLFFFTVCFFLYMPH